MKVRIGNYTWYPLTLLKNLAILVMILLLVWMTVSYGEILVKNTSLTGGAVYSTWNFWMLFG